VARRGAVARFVAFVAAVLGLPAAAFLVVAPTDAETAGPPMLVFLATPALAAFLLSRGLPRPRTTPKPALLPAVGLTAALVTVTGAIAWAAGTVGPGPGFDPSAAIGAVAVALITSTVEELGWAAGGTTVSRAALGPRVGVLALGLVWAAWHLVVAALAPPVTVGGMFGMGDLTPARVTCFVLGVVVYRIVLTALRDRADALWPAAAAHATGNVVLGGALGSGALAFTPDGPWWAFPGPTGLPFLVGAAAIAVLLRRRWATS